VRTTSTDLEVLLGTLQVAETQLRWLMAEALPAGAQYRVDRDATRASAAALASIRVDRRIELEPGWSELVEVDDAIDALLERLVRVDAPLDVVASSRVPVRDVPPLPADIDGPPAPPAPLSWPQASVAATAASPEPAYAEAYSAAVDAGGDGGAYAAGGYDDEYDEYGEEGEGYGYEPAESAEPDSTAAAHLAQHEADASESQSAAGGLADGTPADGVSADVVSADAADAGEADAGEANAGSAEGERGAEAADGAHARASTPTLIADQGIGFGDGEFAGADDHEASGEWGTQRSGRVESIADLHLGGLGGDAITFPTPSATLSEDDLLDDLVERTHAELTLDLPHGSWSEDDEDDVGEPTQIVERRPARPAAAAAVQLSPGGGGYVVGIDDVGDENSEAGSLELGDASAWGDDEPSDSIGLAIARVDVDDDDDIISVSVEALTEPTPAPMITDEEVRELMTDAERLASRDVAQAVLLYSDVIDAEPGNVDALLSRGRLCMDLGDYTRAASDFLKAESRAPGEAEVQVALGDLFFARKEYGRASAYFDAAIRLDESHARSWFRRGLSRFYRKEFAPAVEDMERAKKLDPLLPSVDTFIDRARRRQL
jgi:hypothetical protein